MVLAYFAMWIKTFTELQLFGIAMLNGPLLGSLFSVATIRVVKTLFTKVGGCRHPGSQNRRLRPKTPQQNAMHPLADSLRTA